MPYRVHKLELMKGEQRTPEFLKLNPAGAIPVIVDPEGPGGAPLTLSQSGAIALYAAEKTGKFLPRDPARRALALQWLMFAVTDCASASMMVFFESVLLPEKVPANLAFCEERLMRFFRVADGASRRPRMARRRAVDRGLRALSDLRRAQGLHRRRGRPAEPQALDGGDLGAPGVDKGMRAAGCTQRRSPRADRKKTAGAIHR